MTAQAQHTSTTPRPARRADAGTVGLSQRDIDGLLLCGEHYGAPADLLALALQVPPDRVPAIVARWRRAGYAATGRLGPGPGWCWLTRAGMTETGLGFPATRPALGRLAHIRAVLAARLWMQAGPVWAAGCPWWHSERRLRADTPAAGRGAHLADAEIHWYQGDPVRSAAAARRGQAEAPAGTVARAKLAAQEMRCLAMTGDLAGVSAARRRASAAMSQLGPSAPASGIYSVPRAEDPPYTATSLLLAGRPGEAAAMTRRIIATAYSPHSRAPADQPTNYARTLLILALAAAGLGEIDEAAAAGAAAAGAAAAGAAALESGRVVWPTMVLAGKLDQSLAATSPGSAHAADFRARYIDAGTRLALPAAPSGEGNTGD